MALRQIISKAFLPNFERDLSRSLSSQMATAGEMVDNLMAPQAYAYQKTSGVSSGSGGAFGSTTARQAPVMTKVSYDAPKENGLFQDQEVWHHMTKKSG
jgi:hypothetical protein